MRNNYKSFVCSYSLLIILSGCVSNYKVDWHEATSHRWRPVQTGWFGKPGFTAQKPEDTGVLFSNDLEKKLINENRILLNGSGVSLGDVDSDGLVDIYFSRLDGDNVLYRNLGNWQFEDITEKSGVACSNQFSTGTVLEDIDGDYDLDILVSSIGGPNALLLNDGTGSFEDITGKAGFSFDGGAQTMALADIEGDGDLDIYVSNYKKLGAKDIWDPGELLFQFVVDRTGEEPRIADEYSEHFFLEVRGNNALFFEVGERDILLVNVGNGKFRQETVFKGRYRGQEEEGEHHLKDWGLLVRFQDFDDDGDPDIYVCNDFESPDRLWLNNGTGIFTAADDFFMRNSSNASMAVDFSDINRDGQLDFLVVDMLSQSHKRRMTQRSTEVLLTAPLGIYRNRPQYMKNTLFLNRGDNTYAEIAQMSEIDACLLYSQRSFS